MESEVSIPDFFAVEIFDSYLKGGTWEKALQKFIDVRCASFVLNKEHRDIAGTMFNDIHYQCFLEFRGHFDDLLEDRLQALGVSGERFVKIMQDRMKKTRKISNRVESGDEILESVLQTLKKCSDFECFVHMMEARAHELSLEAPGNHAQAGSTQIVSSFSEKRQHLRVFCFWDIENMPLPRGLSAYSVACAIHQELTSLALATRKESDGLGFAVPYSDFSVFHNPRGPQSLSRKVCKELTRAAVKLVDIGLDKKEMADKVIERECSRIMRDYDNKTTTVVLISQDTDFVQVLKELQESGYSVAVITNSESRQNKSQESTLALSSSPFSWKVIEWGNIVSNLGSCEDDSKVTKTRKEGAATVEHVVDKEKNKPPHMQKGGSNHVGSIQFPAADPNAVYAGLLPHFFFFSYFITIVCLRDSGEVESWRWLGFHPSR